MKPYIKIGIFSEEDLIQKKDKQAIKEYFEKNPDTKNKYINAREIKRKGKIFLEIYMTKLEDTDFF